MVNPLLFVYFQKPGANFQLQYGKDCDNLLLSYNRSLTEISEKLNSKYQLVSKQERPRDKDIVDIAVGFLASNWYHRTRYQAPNRSQIIKWLTKNLDLIKDGAEKRSLISTISFDAGFDPRRIDREAVRKSAVVAEASVRMWDMKCKTESDLARLTEAIESFKRLPSHKSYAPGYAGTYQFACYFVRHDFKALRKALDLFYKAAELNPSPEKIARTKKWAKMWEKHLKDNGY